MRAREGCPDLGMDPAREARAGSGRPIRQAVRLTFLLSDSSFGGSPVRRAFA